MLSGKIELAWIEVSDLQRAKKFYTEILGFDIKEDDSEKYGWLEVGGKEGIALGLAQKKQANPHSIGKNAVVTITVDDFDATMQHLRNNNVKIIGDVLVIPNEVKMQFFADEDGNLFQIVQDLK